MLEVARIGRAHGIRGEVVVTLITDRTERLDPGAELFGPDGPLRVVAARPHGRGWLVRFAGVDDRAAAETLRGTVLRAPADDDADGVWVHQVVGLGVVDSSGVTRGTVVAVQPNPAHDLLELDDGTLVPMVFVVGITDVVTVDPPDGLFE